MPQRGPRAYIVFSYGHAISVYDMAKQADAEVKRLKAKDVEAVKVRMPSRLEAEQYAAWHNYRRP